MFRVSGWLYADRRFREGSVAVEDGLVADVTWQRARDPLARGLVLPAFANAHTHAGDAVVRDELAGTLEDLVAPPYGLKHRVLAEASDEDVVAATRAYLEDMFHTGTATFWDFREMGLRGLRQLYVATLGLPLRSRVFGRPKSLAYDRDEVRGLLRACDGIGISSLLDWNSDEAGKLARDAHAAGKAFALHASERTRENIDAVLALKPDLLVHLTDATDGDLARVAEARVPVAVCPRSNAFFGKVVDLPRMVRAGLSLYLGTDNAMVNAPSMLRELDFAWKVARLRGGVAPQLLLEMAMRGRKGLNEPGNLALTPGEPAELVVLDIPDGRPTFASVFRGVETDISLVSAGGRTWVRKMGELVEPGALRPARRRLQSRRRSSPRVRRGRRRPSKT